MVEKSDCVAIWESALLGGEDVVDGDLLTLVLIGVGAAPVGVGAVLVVVDTTPVSVGAVLVGVFVHSYYPTFLRYDDAASAAQHILPSVGPDSNRRNRQGLEGEIVQTARVKNWLPTR